MGERWVFRQAESLEEYMAVWLADELACSSALMWVDERAASKGPFEAVL